MEVYYISFIYVQILQFYECKFKFKSFNFLHNPRKHRYERYYCEVTAWPPLLLRYSVHSRCDWCGVAARSGIRACAYSFAFILLLSTMGRRSERHRINRNRRLKAYPRPPGMPQRSLRLIRRNLRPTLPLAWRNALACGLRLFRKSLGVRAEPLTMRQWREIDFEPRIVATPHRCPGEKQWRVPQDRRKISAVKRRLFEP